MDQDSGTKKRTDRKKSTKSTKKFIKLQKPSALNHSYHNPPSREQPKCRDLSSPNQQAPIHTTSLAKMSAHQVFQSAFEHVQQPRPPDDYPLELTETQWNELSPDCQALIEILNWYNLTDEVGLFIYKNYPQIAAKIIPALETGLDHFESRRGLFLSQSHEDEYRTRYVTNLAQTALDAHEESNSAANAPEAKSDKPEQANQLQNERPAEATELKEVNVKPEEPNSTIENERPVIHKSYPEIAAEILPALRESLNTLVQRYTTHTLPREFINYYFTRLAQTALDEVQKYTTHPLPKELANEYVTKLAQTAIDELKEHPTPATPETATRPEPEREAEIVSIKPESKPPTRTEIPEQDEPPEKGDKPRNLPKTRAEIGAHQLQALLLLKSTKNPPKSTGLITATKTDVNSRKINMSVSSTAPMKLINNKNGQFKKECLTCDIGCTAECIVNEHLARSLDLPIQSTNTKTATLGDGETNLTIVGETIIDTKYLENPIKVRAMVSKEVEGILLGMPGMERCGIDLDSSEKELHFPNGARVNYIIKRTKKTTEFPQTVPTTHEPGKSDLNSQTKIANSEKHGQEKPPESLGQEKKPKTKQPNLNKAGHQEPGLVNLQSGIQDHRTPDQAPSPKDLGQPTFEEPRPMATREQRPGLVSIQSNNQGHRAEVNTLTPKNQGRPIRHFTYFTDPHYFADTTSPISREPRPETNQGSENPDQKVRIGETRAGNKRPQAESPSRPIKIKKSRSKHQGRGAKSRKPRPEHQGHEKARTRQPSHETETQGLEPKNLGPKNQETKTNESRTQSQSQITGAKKSGPNGINTKKARPEPKSKSGPPPGRTRPESKMKPGIDIVQIPKGQGLAPRPEPEPDSGPQPESSPAPETRPAPKGSEPPKPQDQDQTTRSKLNPATGSEPQHRPDQGDTYKGAAHPAINDSNQVQPRKTRNLLKKRVFSQQSPQPPGHESHPQRAITCLITSRHEPDDENTTPPTTVDHPGVASGEPPNTAPSDTDPDGSDRDMLLSPRGSHQSGDGSNDSSHVDEAPEQESTNEGTPQTNPQSRTQLVPKTSTRPPPPVAEQGTRPRLTSRSGKLPMPPAKLTHTSSFAQHDARDPAGLPPPEPTAQESPSPASSPSDRAHQQTLNPRNQNNHILSDIPHSEYSEPNNSLSTHRITRFANSTGTLRLLTVITVFIMYLFT